MTLQRAPSNAKNLIQDWDWSLYGLIFLFMALPQIYRSYSIYLIGNAIPDTGALATVAQWGFVELLLEVVQETFVLGIFFFVGRSLHGRGNPGESMRTAFTILFLAAIMISVTLFAFSSLFVEIIGTPESIQASTSSFLKVKTIAIPVTLLTAAAVIMVETANRKRILFATAVLSVGYRVLADSLFYGGYSFSLDMGVMGVAWSDALSSVALLATTLYFLRPMLSENLQSWRSFFTLKDWRTYLGVSTGSGADSLVRNVAYFFLIVRLLNLLGEDSISGYYLAMHILWGFLLVPILALSESAKVLIANHSNDLERVKRLWLSSLSIAAAIMLLWVLLLPLWERFASFLNPDPTIVSFSSRSITLLFVPYVLLALNLVTDSVFYGIGRTRYMAYQSIITNGTVYVVAFIAYLGGLWTPTFDTILVLFALGILVDSALTVAFVLRVLPPLRRRSGNALSTA